MDSRTVLSVIAAALVSKSSTHTYTNRQTHHWSRNISRQMAPVTELIFGCHIFVMKFTCMGEDLDMVGDHTNALFTLGGLKG